MRAFAILTLVITGGAAFGAAQGTLPVPLTLVDAIRTALAEQNQIGIAESRQKAAEARVTQSKSSVYPQVNAAWRYNWDRSNYDTGIAAGTRTFSDDTAAISLDLMVFDTGKRKLNIGRSQDALASVTYSVKDVRQTVVLNVTVAWYELLRARDLVRVAEAGAQRAKTTLEATSAFVEAGSSAKKDLFQAQSDYETANVRILQARHSVQTAETVLKNAMGVTALEKVVMSDTQPPPPSPEPDTRTVADYVAMAYANRPDLRSAEADLSATKRSVKIARIDSSVQLDASLSAGYRVTPNAGDDEAFIATLSYPAFDGGARRAAVRESEAAVEQAEMALELTKQDISAEVENAYLSREQARLRISASRTALAASKENYDAATESQKEGISTIIEVTTAENDLITAEVNVVQAIYDYYNADARLRRAVSSLDLSAPVETKP